MPPQQPYQPPAPQGSSGNLPRPAGPPHYGFGSPESQHFQRHPAGHYEVVPPPATTQNNGHSGHNPYDFIVNPNTGPAKPGVFSGGDPFRRVAVLGGGLVVLLIVAAVLISALRPKGPIAGLTSIAQRQQEIIRVSTAAATKTDGQDTTNFVYNVQLTTASSQQKVLSLLQANGTKLGTATLQLDKSARTDTQLAGAATANTYDSAVTTNLVGQLQAYQSLLKTTYSQTNSKTAHQILQADYDSADLLLKQARTLQAGSGS